MTAIDDGSDAGRDEAWLLERKPDATDDQIEGFIERVAIGIYEAKLTESRARLLALKRLFPDE